MTISAFFEVLFSKINQALELYNFLNFHPVEYKIVGKQDFLNRSDAYEVDCSNSRFDSLFVETSSNK